jgi:hypothetical protein
VNALRARFVDYEYRDEIPAGDQAGLLIRLLDLYESKSDEGKGLLPGGRPKALCNVCPNADECWAGAKRAACREPRSRAGGEDDENGAICLPWVGPKYEVGGVVVVGINPNVSPDDYTDLLTEHGISWDYVSQFRLARRARGGSRFGFGAMRSAAALLDVLDGQRPRDRQNPIELVPAVLRTARLQAVKCVPVQPRSRPYAAMWKHCPPFVLGDELDVLRPGTLLGLGDKTHGAITQVGDFEKFSGRVKNVTSGLLRRPGWDAPALVYMLPHPQDGSVAVEAEAALVRLLQRQQKNPRSS